MVEMENDINEENLDSLFGKTLMLSKDNGWSGLPAVLMMI